MNSIAAAPKLDSRIPWVDVAKGIGIALVFYGHFVQRFIGLGVPAAAEQMRWIYSFHMPFFFLLVGYVYKDRGLSFEQFLKRQFLTRLVPVWVFSILTMFVWIGSEYAAGSSGWVERFGWQGLMRHCASETFAVVVQGRPSWNLLTWFLICLFVAEIWHFALHRWVRRNRYLVVSIVCVGAGVVLMDLYADSIHERVGARRHWWLATSSVAALWFYQVGILLRRLGWLNRSKSKLQLCVLTAAFLVVSLLTFNLNRSLGEQPLPVVLMVVAYYGNIGWFLVGSLAGTGFVIHLSRILSASRVLRYVGGITLVLMCLDGILHEFVNPAVAEFIARAVPTPHVLLLTGICAIGTVLSLLVCLPVNWLLERYVPFALGRSGRWRVRSSRPAPAGTESTGSR
ncbi:MAG: acyltransferase family protein [Planctomycetes bacterium]|nr:acyltransferase family protein [Planctomycetota bacterium]